MPKQRGALVVALHVHAQLAGESLGAAAGAIARQRSQDAIQREAEALFRAEPGLSAGLALAGLLGGDVQVLGAAALRQPAAQLFLDGLRAVHRLGPSAGAAATVRGIRASSSSSSSSSV